LLFPDDPAAPVLDAPRLLIRLAPRAMTLHDSTRAGQLGVERRRNPRFARAFAG
jgi:hypothetical protein